MKPLGCLRRWVIAAMIGMVCGGAAPVSAQPSPPTNAKLVSAQEYKRNGFPVSRWSSVHELTVHFVVKISERSYCAAYETIVVNEVQDLVSSTGKNVQAEVSDKKLQMILPSGRKIKASLLGDNQC